MGRVDSLTGRWSVYGASVLGAAHVRHSLPNQDAYRCIAEATTPVAVVADGHGAAEYVRSATGARLAADLLAEELRDLSAADNSPLAAAADRFVERWRAGVRADAAAAPFSREELAAMAGPAEHSDGDLVRAYGTTALGLCVTGDWVHALAIGDGDLGCVDADGKHHTLCPAPASIGVQTDSLAAADVAVRTDSHPMADVVAVWACTDGFSTAQTDPDWRDLVGGQLRQLLATRAPDEIGADLDGWLEPAAAVGDDTTMVLVLREGLTDRLPQRGKGKHYDLLPPTVPPRTRRRPLWRLLGVR